MLSSLSFLLTLNVFLMSLISTILYIVLLISINLLFKKKEKKGTNKLNISQLKCIGSPGLSFLTSMFKTALNTNIIPHIWKLANIVPIPKPNKDIDKGTSYRFIPLLSVIAKMPEKNILPYITATIPTTPT